MGDPGLVQLIAGLVATMLQPLFAHQLTPVTEQLLDTSEASPQTKSGWHSGDAGSSENFRPGQCERTGEPG